MGGLSIQNGDGLFFGETDSHLGGDCFLRVFLGNLRS